jgi:hypothetical protein
VLNCAVVNQEGFFFVIFVVRIFQKRTRCGAYAPLAVLAALVGATLIYFGYFTPWELGVWLFV